MLLSVENLQVSYGNIKALHGFSFRIDEGEIVCIIGANGAGKSTTLRRFPGFFPSKRGTKMTFIGPGPARISRRQGGQRAPDLPCSGRETSVRQPDVLENLRLASFARKDRRAIGEDLDGYFRSSPVERAAGSDAGTMSGGEQQMLAVGRAFMSGRKIMLLDEPSMGLAPLLMKSVFDSLKGNQPGRDHHSDRRAECPDGAPNSPVGGTYWRTAGSFWKAGPNHFSPTPRSKKLIWGVDHTPRRSNQTICH